MRESISKQIPEEVIEVMHQMRLAAIYNRATGANITHFDLEEWGMKDELKVLLALDLWDIL